LDVLWTPIAAAGGVNKGSLEEALEEAIIILNFSETILVIIVIIIISGMIMA